MVKSLDPALVDRLIGCIIAHLRTATGLDATLAGEIEDVDRIAITIDFAGELRGPITWVFPEAVALELVRRLMADPCPDPELALDGATELANILTGRASSELEQAGFHCEFGTPRRHVGDLPAGVRLQMTTDGGPIDVVLSMSRTRSIPVVRVLS